MSEPKLTEAEIQQINEEARAYSETLVDAENVDGTPQYICYIKGATTYALRAKELKENYFANLDELARKDKQIAELEALLKSKDDRWEEVREEVNARREKKLITVKDESRPTPLRDIAFGNVEACDLILPLLSDKTDSQPKGREFIVDAGDNGERFKS